MSQPNLNLPTKAGDPVECLGQTFASEDARREHFLKLLAQKLKDPEFRKIEGFPIGKDADILALSDPPYYTACPNPWLGEFINAYGTPYDPKQPYHREPFAADVSEGKTHPIYKAHSYHTKVPHRAIMRYLLHYTQPADVVFDGFCGTGMTGVAAQLCGDRNEVQELGYRVQDDGTILNDEGKPFSKLGARRAILNDLSTAATFIGYNYNTDINADAFEQEAKRILKEVEDELGWMYQTKHKDGSIHRFDFTVWSEVYSCPECAGEITFLDEAFDEETNKVSEEFTCPSCGALLTKRKVDRIFDTRVDPRLGESWRRVKFKPCLIEYRVGRQKLQKQLDSDDERILEKVKKMAWPKELPTNAWPISEMYHGSRIQPKGFTHSHRFFVDRVAIILGLLWNKATSHSNPRMRAYLCFWVEQAFWTMSMCNSYRPAGYSQVSQYMKGIYYIPAQHSELSPWYVLAGKAKRLAGVIRETRYSPQRPALQTASATAPNLPASSVDYIFTDPPFGENIFYGDLNLMYESWYRVLTNTGSEAIIDKPKGKELPEYQQLASSAEFVGEFIRFG